MDPHSEKLLDLEPQKMNADPQPCIEHRQGKLAVTIQDIKIKNTGRSCNKKLRTILNPEIPVHNFLAVFKSATAPYIANYRYRTFFASFTKTKNYFLHGLIKGTVSREKLFS